MHLVKENELTLEKKHLLLDFPYLGIIYLRTRTKPQQALKVALNCCKIEIAFECQTGLSNSFCYKEHIPKDLIPRIVYKFHCGLCDELYSDESMRHLDIRSGEHINLSPLNERTSNNLISVLFVIIYYTIFYKRNCSSELNTN